MHILVVFTGGTIGSSVMDGCIAPDAGKGYRLLEYYETVCAKEFLPDDYEFVTAEPFRILSENMNCKTVLQLIDELKRQTAQQEYDGIIVCHGTDTLQYTAAMTGYCFGVSSVPIVFVSSNYVLEDERANGLDNFAAAVSFIVRKAGRGVFVAYKNTGDLARIHRASRVLPHLPYSDDIVSLMGVE
ncbi:MAG: asparaginase, partial [Butyrivibrio sp.]|nr:asparaginase [Butyrivibrio sp.]